MLAAEARRLELHLLLRPEGGEQVPGGAAGADCSSQHGPHGGPPPLARALTHLIKSAQCDCDIPLCAFAVDGVVPPGPSWGGGGRQARDKLSRQSVGRNRYRHQTRADVHTAQINNTKI